MPSRLIEARDSAGQDCLRLRLTKDAEPSAYILLSYCWGGDQPLKSEKGRVAELAKGFQYEQLPKTLQDAVTVCRHLGVRFLWVDAICLIQDDEADKAQQIAQMPTIYKNGYLTIIAGSASDTSQGFLGNRPEPHSKTLAYDFPYRCPNGQTGTVTLLELKDTKFLDPLDSREWALQERMLSPRIVGFSCLQVRWLYLRSFGKHDWNDGWLLGPKLDSYAGDVQASRHFIHSPRTAGLSQGFEHEWKSPRSWHRFVRSYTGRELTNPKDRILALSGIAKKYPAALEDTYLAGLWKNSLLKELL